MTRRQLPALSGGSYHVPLITIAYQRAYYCSFHISSHSGTTTTGYRVVMEPLRCETNGARPSPTMQQRIKALGVPTPLAISSPVRRYVGIVR